METILNVFSIPLTAFGVNAALAAATALIAAGGWCAYRRIRYGAWIRMAVLALPLMLLCSRILYAVGNVLYYTRTVGDLTKMLHFWDGGASVLGALLGLILAAAITERWQKLRPGMLQDAVAIGAPIGLIIERLSEAGTELGMGQTIDADWMATHPFFAVDDGYGYIVHAVFRYEAIVAAVLLLALLVWVIVRKGDTGAHGDLLLVMLTLLGSSQALLESLRNDGHMLIGFVRVNQIVSIVLPVVALSVWTARAHRGHHGFDWKLLLMWLLAAGGITIATVQEFAVDSSDNVLLDYGIMAAGLAMVVAAALITRRWTRKINYE